MSDAPRTFKLLTSAHTTRVVFDRREGGREIVACFGCVACETLLHWNGTVWVCPDCEQELFPDEATFLVDRSTVALTSLRSLFPRTRGGFLWALVQWFRKLWSGQARSRT